MPHHTEQLPDWLFSDRLYENSLFFYVLIVLFWFFIGFIFMGFEIAGFSQKVNLLLNFVFYLVICACMALSPVWFWLIFKNTDTAQRELELYSILDDLDDEDYWQLKQELYQTGGLPMQSVQRWALVFLGSYFLFEVFFISSWVKELALVWEPEWATWLIEWAISHTNTPPLNVDRDLFLLDDEIRTLGYANEHLFMNSAFGHAVMLYRVIKTLFFIPVMIALTIILWQSMDWLGFWRVDPRYIHNVLSFIYRLFLSIGMFLLFFGAMLAFISGIELVVPYIYGKFNWLGLFWQHIGLIFILFYLKFLVGWFVFLSKLSNYFNRE